MAETTTPKKRGRKAAAAGQPVTQEVVVMVPLAELHPFPDHPFQVRDNESMRETAASVKENGVIIPGLVRPREEGGYEIIAGHRRKHACELAGLTAMPVIVRDISITPNIQTGKEAGKNFLPLFTILKICMI